MTETLTIGEAARHFVASPRELFIDGTWVPALSGETFDSIDPSTGVVSSVLARGRAHDVDRAVAAARRAFDDGPWPRWTPVRRARCLLQLADLLEQHQDELGALETLDVGMPLWVPRDFLVPAAAEVYRYFAGWATKLEGSTIPLANPFPADAQFFAYTLREPMGVVAAIVPWNGPLTLSTNKVAPALATGNTVVLKPAEHTSLSALRVAELAIEAGIPAGVLNVVTGFGEDVGAALAAHPGVDKITFTGSTEVGRQVLRAASANFKKVTLELGGKSPNIVFADADLALAIPGAAAAIFFNSGEVCTAGSRLYIEEAVFDEVLEGIGDYARSLHIGGGLEDGTQLGPVISAEHQARVMGYIEAGIADGARIVAGGHAVDRPGYFVQPTILADVRPDMSVVREEIFGPVVTALPFRDIDGVVQQANDTRYGLAAGLWTRDLSRAHRTAAAMKAGSVWINCYNVFDPAVPYGGYKESGWGREQGAQALDAFTQVKSVVAQL